MWLLLSRRLRRWVLLAVGLPLLGRLLESAGGRVEQTRGPGRLSRGLLGGATLLRSTRGGRRRRR